MAKTMMFFPETVEEFMEQNKIVDTEQIYTNGAELIPIFRMKQWFISHPCEPLRWIPVTEKLPEKSNFYICTMKDGLVISVWCSRFHGFEKEDVIAWMPLPEPYKGGEEE